MLLAATVTIGCGEPPAPVLSAMPAPASVDAVTAKRLEQERRTTPGAVDPGYARADGVYIDLRYFGGRSWDAARAEVERQFGPVMEETTPAGAATGERDVRLLRGSIHLRDNRIQKMTVPLPEPVRRSEALALLGLPPFVGNYNSLALEFRLTNEWGFRRIRFLRTERGAEEIESVEALSFSADDR